MAGTQSNVVRFPVRSTNPQLPNPCAQLLNAAKAALSALLLAVPNAEQNTIVSNLGKAIRAAESPEPPITPAPAQRCEVSYSFGDDLTGDRAVMCGRPADVHCEHCGPICLSCLSDASCLGTEHCILAPPAKPQPAQLLKELRSRTCVCGNRKTPRQPFCSACYYALPPVLRAKMWLSPLDSDELLDRMVEARNHLDRMGMFSKEGVA